jgi:hypothetical protein
LINCRPQGEDQLAPIDISTAQVQKQKCILPLNNNSKAAGYS